MTFDHVEWLRSTNELAARSTHGFQERFGYPPGDNTAVQAGEPVSEQVAGMLPRPLVEFYRHVSGVTLGDLHVGYFIQTAQDTVRGLSGTLPVRLDGPAAIDIVTFGSDGGGTLFALGMPDGEPVYRLPASGVDERGVYDNSDSRARVIAATLPEFLTNLHALLLEAARANPHRS
ncbi:SMI1/KNR4 family protein [Kibdelosporangium phytohabitans]|uniref:Knr4/Smi1-like domain-containing protein n=1 Tax=Kibdelosporangium phytohabitans TaxID=860235 RepID=A0A0N9I450_9PSEU|nr:SMI1/KNR4 family protein [Kibdelosporangium phytohabitans]ALG09346.1 hypothetical protein AOZ06_22710 [Kibdelosporangium phytohabitans]MBE1469390.1 hypothetical protein [Kibdelosporangium phytohabitans]